MSASIEHFIKILLAFVISFLSSFLIIKLLLKSKNRGQVERDFAMQSHLKKQGTPTMGGIAFVVSTIITSLLFIKDVFYKIDILMILAVYFLFFLIGFFDDYLKIKFKSYEGVRASLRFVLEIAISLLCVSFLGFYVNKHSYIELELINLVIPVGIFLIPLIVFIIVGVSNSVNLGDGLDGLAGGLMLTAFIPFLLVSLKENNFDISYIIISQIGSIIAFLLFNIHPAKIFMGDCGSLALGALISFIAIYLEEYLLLVITTSFFIFETLSVIIQVIYYKFTKKRIFLMAPFHHHLEKKGWPEWKIVMLLWTYGFAMATLGIITKLI